MGINIADNFAYNGKKPLDNRTEYTTLSAMKAVADANINEGCLAYNKEDGKYYKFLSTNTVDATTGKWREFPQGGGGGTGGGHTIQDDGVDMTARDNLNFVGFNVTDDSTNNRTTVTFPNIDLSVLSNEAFILDTNEKAIGMASNRKLLYQRYVEKTTPNSSSLISLFSEQNLENCYFAGGYFVDANGYDVPINRYEDGVTDVGVSIKSDGTQMYFGVGSGSSGRPARFIIRYTKTTDSPLASDVKFAGVDENGNVVLKKVVTGTTTNNTGEASVSIGTGLNNIMIGEGGVTIDNGHSYRGGNANNVQVYVDGSNLCVYVDYNIYYNKPFKYTIYFTLAS